MGGSELKHQYFKKKKKKRNKMPSTKQDWMERFKW
jgi:hypothetical protein